MMTIDFFGDSMVVDIDGAKIKFRSRVSSFHRLKPDQMYIESSGIILDRKDLVTVIDRLSEWIERTE